MEQKLASAYITLFEGRLATQCPANKRVGYKEYVVDVVLSPTSCDVQRHEVKNRKYY